MMCGAFASSTNLGRHCDPFPIEKVGVSPWEVRIEVSNSASQKHQNVCGWVERDIIVFGLPSAFAAGVSKQAQFASAVGPMSLLSLPVP